MLAKFIWVLPALCRNNLVTSPSRVPSERVLERAKAKGEARAAVVKLNDNWMVVPSKVLTYDYSSKGIACPG